MTDVLDQSEIDALLSAVAGGETFDELSGLPAAFAPPGLRKPAAARDVVDYDFRRAERVSKDQIRSLEAIHENFARNFGASISSFLRTIIEVHVASIEQITYSEFIYSLPNPTCFNLLTAAPLQGQLCMEISPLIVFPIIDRLLGGSSSELYIPQRPLTNIELRLMKRIIDRALEAMSEAWASLLPVRFELAETESNPHMVQIVAPTEIVVMIGFEIKSGSRTGTMSLCIPFNVIEPIVGKLAHQTWHSTQRQPSTQEQVKKVARSLNRANVEVRVFLAETTISMRDLLNLQVGDVIRTDKEASEPCTLQVLGRNKFAGQLGRFRGHRCLRITRRAAAEDPL